MPHLRVVTWNSGGEADGRGLALDQTITSINQAINGLGAPQNEPTQVVVIQEANQGANGLISQYIQNQINNGAGLFSNFDRTNISEHHALQVMKVGHSRGYIACLRTAGASPVAAAAPAMNMIGANAGGGPLYRVDLWNDAGAVGALAPYNGNTLTALQNALRHHRWPVFRCLTVGGVNVVVITVHLELKANWLGADVLAPGWAQGLRATMQLFLQPSTWFAAATAWVGMNGLIVITGDLNATAAELGQAGVLPNFDGVSDNLSHILAWSPGNAVNITNHWAQNPNFPPHHILTAAIDW